MRKLREMLKMKRLLIVTVILTLSYAGICQESIETDTVHTQKNSTIPSFHTTVRFKPAALLVSAVAYRAVDLEFVIVPYVHPKIGIPVEMQLVYIQRSFGVVFMTGIEAVPVTHREKSGLYMNLEGGLITVGGLFGFCATSNIGYQLVSKLGFVFTPAAGAKYDHISKKVSLNLMLDIGFAF